ncbi:MAG: hypothetical protein EBT22_14005, partial [Chloroflexi bacterium]|nr:hypothetical protein [Chloroflexota bacterium]
AYFDLIGLVIHPRLRPRYFSWQQAATAVGGIVSAFGARWVLGALQFPWNFVASFSVGLTLVVAVTGVFLQVREPPPVSDPRPTEPASALPAGPETSHRPAWHQSVVAIWRSDGGFRRLVLTRALIGIAGMAPAYYAVSAVRRLAASDMDAATFGLIALGSQLVGTLMWGEIVARSRRPWFLVGGTIIGAHGHHPVLNRRTGCWGCNISNLGIRCGQWDFYCCVLSSRCQRRDRRTHAWTTIAPERPGNC